MTARRHTTSRSFVFSCALVIANGCLAAGFSVSNFFEREIECALNTHPRIHASLAAVEKARYDINVAQGERLPTIDLEYRHGNRQREFGAVTLNQLLFTGFRVSNQIAFNRFQHASARFEFESERNEVAFEAASAYLNVQRQLEQLELSKKNVATHRTTLKKISKRFDSGVGRRYEYNLARSRLSLAISRLQRDERDLEIARYQYVQIIGHMPPKRLPRIRSYLHYVPPAYEAAQHIANLHNPTLQSAKALVKAACAQSKVVGSAFMPQIAVNVEGNIENDDLFDSHKREFNISGVMTYNVFRGGTDAAQLRGANAVIKRVRYQEKNIRREVFNDVSNEWQRVMANGRITRSLRQYADYSAKVVEDYIKQFLLGKRALFNVLDQQNETYLANQQWVNTRYDRKIAEFRLFADMGMIVEYLFSERDTTKYSPVTPTPAKK